MLLTWLAIMLSVVEVEYKESIGRQPDGCQRGIALTLTCDSASRRVKLRLLVRGASGPVGEYWGKLGALPA